jgi:hypothetical protein
MNRYLFEQFSRGRRDSLIAEAATNRLVTRFAAEQRMAEDRPLSGFWASVRRALVSPDGDSTGFLPRLNGYPTARP